MSEKREEVDLRRLTDSDIPSREGWSVDVKSDPRGPIVSNPDVNEGMLLSNRYFESIDYYVSYKYLALFIKKIKENPGRKIVILDLGGGVESEAIRGILRHPFLKGKVKVINVDLFARNIPERELQDEGIDPSDIVILNEDFATEGVVPDESVDAVMSYQMLDYVNDARLPIVLENVSKVLAHGGEALMNEVWRITRGMGGLWGELHVFPHGGFFGMGNESSLQRIANKHEVMIRSTFGETQLDGTTHLFGGGSGMIYMTKPRTIGGFDFPQLDFRLAWPEIVDAVKDYGVELPEVVRMELRR